MPHLIALELKLLEGCNLTLRPGVYQVASAEEALRGDGPQGALALHALALPVREIRSPVHTHYGGRVTLRIERAVIVLPVQLRRVGLHQGEAVELPFA